MKGFTLIEYTVVASILALVVVFSVRILERAPTVGEHNRIVVEDPEEEFIHTVRNHCEELDKKAYWNGQSTSDVSCVAIFLKDIRDEMRRN